MLFHPTTNYLITIETDHNTYPALIQGGLRQALVEAQQEPSSTAAEGDSDTVKHEKKEDHMETVENGDSKEARLQKLQELQQQQTQQEEYSRVFGADKAGTYFP